MRLRFRSKGKYDSLRGGPSLLPNAEAPLSIPTYEGSNQVVHPSVIDFSLEHGIPQWHGYRYWMVLTPFPYSNDSFENPSLFVSNDGTVWTVPPNVMNPLATASGGMRMGFNSDPDMVYDPNVDEVRIYYRFTSKDEMVLKMIRVTDVVSAPVDVIRYSPWKEVDNNFRSVCVWRESADRWHMWGGGRERAPYGVFYRFSRDGISWERPQLCVDDMGGDPFVRSGYTNWHMSCKPDGSEGRVNFLSCAYPLQSIGMGVILHAECKKERPTTLTTPIGRPVLLPSQSGWDNETLYRCSFTIGPEKDHYNIWYSARSKKGVWRLGHTSGYVRRG